MSSPRVKVRIYCKQCGERFVLRGSYGKGKLDTGFKRCLCDNEHDLDIDVLE
ncbi:hypothetical protein MJA45_16920 [Paenibacillus aurantius]|uniref:Uncharacterized protein n=1 Tax=Paenibacillus aurantius TaxID=2918900 RepID=A0AA96RBA4_9BACL|nr:hypothetical protein [Paenibacillus aurantius]WJH34221.1 hypothetical protein N6H14_30675 [Paenibacillus sp. CC-CFT747]WNQ09310.1 hypothetical protein MJA45_16920 [Paenibacillus aurantius]